ncbi:MAG: hypothetical protein ACYC7D_00865 [Nitrososphaerales archaeon]
MIEFDLVMKGREYTSNQRKNAFDLLAGSIPEEKIISNSTDSLKIVIDVEEKGIGYFDSLISALAIEKDAVALTPDKVMSEVVKTKW